jgi:hypothetical protein
MVSPRFMLRELLTHPLKQKIYFAAGMYTWPAATSSALKRPASPGAAAFHLLLR